MLVIEGLNKENITVTLYATGRLLNQSFEQTAKEIARVNGLHPYTWTIEENKHLNMVDGRTVIC